MGEGDADAQLMLRYAAGDARAFDALYERGMASGALGGKLLGAGGGGFFLFFVPPNDRSRFKASIGVPTVDVRVSRSGSHALVVEP